MALHEGRNVPGTGGGGRKIHSLRKWKTGRIGHFRGVIEGARGKQVT